MFDFKDMTPEELQTRSEELSQRAGEIEAEIRSGMENLTEERLQELNTEADTNAEERRQITAELEARKQAATAAAEERKAAFENGSRPKNINTKGKNEMENRFAVDSIEYRDAWTKRLIGRDLNEEERAALTSAGAVIPTMTVNAVWDKLVKESVLLSKVDVTQFPTYVRFPKATTNNAATAAAVGATITESSDVIGYVDLVPNEYTKLLTVGADIDHMAVPAVHDWIVNNLVGQIRYAINKDILVGTGTNSLKGITASVNAAATALTAAGVTKADLLKVMAALGSQYQAGAIWVMTP